MLCRLSFNEDLSVRPQWLPPCFGDYRFSVPEWWHTDRRDFHQWIWQTESETVRWKKSRISWIKIRWCIPHLLRLMWLECEVKDSEAAMVIFLGESGSTMKDAIPFLQTKLKEWKEKEDRLHDLHRLYRYFQCSVFYSGFHANVIRPSLCCAFF